MTTNRIDKRFATLKEEGRKGLVTFLSAGDPDAKTSAELISMLPDAGADFIEIGMPFSDPMADGPAIQAASLRALENGAHMDQTFSITETLREKDSQVPVILMGYYNPIYAYGTDRFVKKCVSAGVDGLIIVDLPPEEDAEFRPLAEKAGIRIIRLASPTTDENRLPVVLDGASGFIYYVSITGVTGTASADIDALKPRIDAIRQKTDLPIAIGFGIKTPQDVKDMSVLGDAVVVGSALVQTIEDTPREALKNTLFAQVKALAEAL